MHEARTEDRSGPKLMKPRRSRPTRSCPSFKPLQRVAGIDVETRDISLAGRIIANFPENLTAAQRQSDDLAVPGRTREDTGSQHHQAAEHQRFHPAAEGRHQGTAGQGLQHPGLSGGAEDRRRERDQGALREGSRQRREPGAARRQLGPPRGALGEAVRPQASAQDGRVERRTRKRTSRT